MNPKLFRLRRVAGAATAGLVAGGALAVAGVAPAHASSYTATYASATRSLTKVTNASVESLPDSALVGQVTNFQIDDPTQSCLNGTSLNLWTAPNEYPGKYVVHNGGQGTQCTFGTWTFNRVGVSASPSSLTFPQTNVGATSAAQTVTVSSSGPDALAVSGATLGGANASDFSKTSDSCSGASVAQGQSCTVQVAFAPQSAGSKSATLTITSNGATQTISLSGTAGTPAAAVSPNKLTFSAGAGTSDPQTVTVSSTGTANLSVSSVSITGTAAGDFDVSGDGCSGQVIAPGDSCTFDVTFTPSVSGTRTASAVVATNAGNKTVSLTGSGDLAPPTTSFSTGNNSVVLPAGLGTINGFVTDNLSGVDRVQVTMTPLLPTGPTTVFAQLACNSTGRSCTWSVASPTVPGVYTVSARATDLAGNEEFPGPAPITVVV